MSTTWQYMRLPVIILCSLLLSEAVRRNHETRGASDHDIETVIKQWFRTAGDRDGGRRRRTAPAAAPAQIA